MKYFAWDTEKNEKLKKERNISFERVLLHIERGDLLDVLDHPNPKKYSDQRIFVVQIEGYVYVVPFSEDESQIVLKTIFPSRKLTRRYLHEKGEDE